MSIVDRFDQLDLSAEDRELQVGMWSEHFNARPSCARSPRHALCAAASGNRQLMDDATSTYRIATGTGHWPRASPPTPQPTSDSARWSGGSTSPRHSAGADRGWHRVRGPRVIVTLPLMRCRHRVHPELPPLIGVAVTERMASRA